MATLAVYPGRFDPFTVGHHDIAQRAAKLFDRLLIAIPEADSKSACLPVDQRVDVLTQLFKDHGQIDVILFPGLLSTFIQAQGATVVVRGMRNPMDWQMEMQMAQMNKALFPALETILLPCSPEHSHISASLVREVIANGGDISAFVPSLVAQAL